MQNEKGMFDNYSNLPAKSPFIVQKDHLRHKCCQGDLPGCFQFSLRTKDEIEAVCKSFIL